MAIVIAGRYELLNTSPMGRGHFGEVWRARDHVQGHDIALKLLLPGNFPVELRRAIAYQEARFLTELRGPRILPIEDAGTDARRDVAFLAMGIAAEGSTEDALKREPHGVYPYQALDWTNQMLVGLQSAHGAGVVHGDVKPGNMLLERADSSLLGDFGVAQRMDGAGRVPAAGDLLVAAPETVRDNFSDVRSDIYAAGVSLFRLLSGRWPYAAANAFELEAAILQGRQHSLRSVAPHVPLAVTRTVETAMHRVPDERFQDAQAMREELTRVGVFTRTWRRDPPHSGHAACWNETRPAGAAHSVCVEENGGRFSIHTRRGGGGTRHALTRTEIRGHQLPATLRGLFRELGQ